MSSPQLAEPRNRRWSRAEYHQMLDLGWFIDQRVELIGGEIVEMPSQKFPHYVAIDKGSRCLEKTLGSGFWVRTQAPLRLPLDSEPNPDISVCAGKREDYADHPTTALLVIEVSDTTLRYDRGAKASLDARAGIADYWIVNLVDRQLEVRRQPLPDGSQAFGFGYTQETILAPADSVTPLAAPQARIAVADLLP